jgi:hypothetical protein
VGGLLRRDLLGKGGGGGVLPPSEACCELADLPQVAWAEGLRDKGAVEAIPGGRVGNFVVIGGETRLGLGLLFAGESSSFQILVFYMNELPADYCTPNGSRFPRPAGPTSGVQQLLHEGSI